ncbi:MAG: ComEC/Rec2 family competence protein [Clostridiales bacterium]|nr:ComEC/Rec2 family competence protein [Clostridiales bacterium]
MQKIKRFNLRPAVFSALSVCLGVVAAYNFILNSVVWGVICCALFLSLCVAVFLPVNKEFSSLAKTILCCVISVLFVVSGALMHYAIKDYENASLDNHYYGITAHVSDSADTLTGKRLIIENITVDGNIKGKLSYKAYVYIKGNIDIDVGDKVTFSSYLIDNPIIYDNSFSAYNLIYKTKYTAEVNAGSIKVISSEPTVFESINIFIRDTLSTALERDEFSVAYAMLTGNDEQIDYELLSSYRYAGIAHIFAVSGLHIGFLATTLSFVFDKLKANRLLKAIVISFSLFFYSGICGFSASSIRAAVMTSVMLFSAVKGDRYDGLSSISLAAILILIFSPVQLFSVGFQLSFVVVLGMMVLTKPIEKLLKFLPKKVASSLAIVLAAQISSIPVCLDNFGYFSPVAVLLNIIFIPVASVIFIALLIAVIIGGLFNIANITLFLPKYVLYFINVVINAVDFEKLVVGGFAFGILTFVYYAACIIPSNFINLKRIHRIIALIVCTIIGVVSSVAIGVIKNEKTEVFVVGSERLCVTIIDAKDENILFASKASYGFSAARLKSISDRYGVKNIDTVVFFNDTSIDAQVFMTKLNTVFDLEKVIYFGDKDDMKEKIIEKSFGVQMENANAHQDFIAGDILCEYVIDGRAITAEIKGKRFAIFSFNEVDSYYGLNGKFDLMVCSFNADLALNFYKPKHPISYRHSSVFTDGETFGTAIIEFI